MTRFKVETFVISTKLQIDKSYRAVPVSSPRESGQCLTWTGEILVLLTYMTDVGPVVRSEMQISRKML